MNPCKIWIDQCDAARNIEDQFGTDKALSYLIGEKFLNFLEAAETHADFRAEIPAFVAEIKSIFERWQLAEYLETGMTPDGDSAGDLMAEVIDNGLKYLRKEDRAAIAEYVLSLPPVEHSVRKAKKPVKKEEFE